MTTTQELPVQMTAHNTISEGDSMTMTATTPTDLNQSANAAVAASAQASLITADIHDRVQAAIAEMSADLKERETLVKNMWVARIGQLHLLMLGPGGTGKSYAVRRLTQHIVGSVYFEAAFDETTDPSQIFGPPNVKAMVEDGKTRRVIEGMMPEATDVFLDEFFNGNGPLLHSTMPLLNERVFHNNGKPSRIPLRSAFMGTNKLNADADQAALWDRVHIREIVEYVTDRRNQMDLIGEAVARMAIVGRGTDTLVPGQHKTTLTLDELDQAHTEALSLVVPDATFNMFCDIREELGKGEAQVQISDRRAVESMVAVMANAWVNGHEEVKVGDLDILASMWWTVQEQRPEARKVILAAVNPGEKAALDLLEDLDAIKEEIAQGLKPDVDSHRKTRIGVEQVKALDKVRDDAKEHLAKAEAAGVSTTRIKEVLAKTNATKKQVGEDYFGITADQQDDLENA